ncbi:MAG: phage holin family protein [Flavobacteriales bacterium]|nr:phage holin family protein [Flavobacteriales bacterium]
MEVLYRIITTALLVLLLPQFLSGVAIDGFATSVIVALVLGFLNIIVKPILILFTLPITVFTLGLFLLVINALIIQICDGLVSGFAVKSFWSALVFSILLSICQSIVYSITGLNEKKH